jgi:Ferric reductase like transmembrane component
VAAFLLMLVYFAAMHANGILLLLLGLPFERTLPWHRLLAVSTFIQSIMHGLSYYVSGKAVQHLTHVEFQNVSYGYAMETTGSDAGCVGMHCHLVTPGWHMAPCASYG